MNPASTRRRRWRRGSITGGVLIVIALSIYFVPSIFLRQYVNDYFAAQGLKAEGVEHVRINPYGPSLETDSLTLTNDEGTVFHLDSLELFLQFTPLMQRRVDVGGANLVGLELYVSEHDDGTIALRGLPMNANASSDTDAQTLGGWLFGVSHVELEDAIIHLDLRHLQGDLTIDELVIENVKAWKPGQVSNLTAEGTFGNSPYSIELELLPFPERPNGKLKFSADDIPVENIDIGSPLSGVVSAVIDGNFEGDSGWENLTADFNGTISAKDLEIVLQPGQRAMTARAEHQESTLQVSARRNAGELEIRAEGKSSAQNLTLAGENLTLATVESASVTQWTWENGEFNTPEVLLLTGSLSSIDETSLAVFETLSVTELTYSADGKGTVADISLGGLTGTVTLTGEGIVELGDIRSYFPVSEGEGTPAANPTVESEPARWSAALVHLADAAQIEFTDRTLAVPAQYGLNVSVLSLANFNTAQPATLSDFEFVAAIDEAGELEIKGGVAPLTTPSPSFDLTIDIRNLELPRASPYAKHYLGINLDRGQLNLHATGRSDAGELNAKTDWIIERIEVSQGDDYDEKLLAQQLDVPITTAVRLLQDRDDDIELDVPVSGQLNSPDFDLGDAVGQAMAKAMQGALLTSIKIAFPVVALADLVIQGGDVSLKPVVFSPLQDDINDEANAYINSLAKLMNERPKVAITTCGVAVREDLRAFRIETIEKEIAQSLKADGYPLEAARIDTEAVDPGSDRVDEPPEDFMVAPLASEEREQLQRLAERRAERVETILREEHGIDPSRLFDCRSDVKPDDQDVPRVRVTL